MDLLVQERRLRQGTPGRLAREGPDLPREGVELSAQHTTVCLLRGVGLVEVLGGGLDPGEPVEQVKHLAVPGVLRLGESFL